MESQACIREYINPHNSQRPFVDFEKTDDFMYSHLYSKFAYNNAI